ncbi:hypothetical protein URH17368_2941 [Alicyclobacillus hesperidum URH17-3-68]|nr:hypothetical protein URH17368_2941 [Alicyclobacillus hesperidum URH17-3-68]
MKPNVGLQSAEGSNGQYQSQSNSNDLGQAQTNLGSDSH